MPDLLNDDVVIHTVVWDPAEPMATRPLLLQTSAGWYTYGFDQVKEQKSAKLKPEAQGDRDFEAVRTHGARSGNPRRRGNCNVTEFFDSLGNIAATYDYGPFGENMTASGPAAALNPIRFSSEVGDAALDLVQYNYRPYNPLDGRFTTRDPIEERGGLNLYGFAGNDPVNKTDYLGLASMPWGMECCGGKLYDPDRQCCLTKQSTDIIGDIFASSPKTSTHIEYEIHDRAPKDTGVVRYKWLPGGGQVHHWIAWPGGTADVNGVSVLNPGYKNEMVRSPATIPAGNKNTITPTSITLSPCEYDTEKFSGCIGTTVARMIGQPFNGLCDAFVDYLVDTCKMESKR